jgi:hypothetical protein
MADPAGSADWHLRVPETPTAPTPELADQAEDDQDVGPLVQDGYDPVHEPSATLTVPLVVGDSSGEATRSTFRIGQQETQVMGTQIADIIDHSQWSQDTTLLCSPNRPTGDDMARGGPGGPTETEACSTGEAEEAPLFKKMAPSVNNQKGETPHDPDSSSGASESPSSVSKGKQKQKNVHFAPPTLQKENTNAGPSVEPDATRTKATDTEWQTHVDSPPAKLPIRFKDAVGRFYLFPWEKAKTWEVLPSFLIRSSHACVVFSSLSPLIALYLT